MDRSPSLRFLSLIVLSFFIQACDSGTKKGVGKYGMMEANVPDLAAVAFFESVYRDKNLSYAISLSTPRMAKLLNHYRTNRNVQRHVFDLPFDEVEVQPDGGNGIGRTEFAKSATVTLFFTGIIHGNRVEDIRIVEMVRTDGKWLVDKIQADKYL